MSVLNKDFVRPLDHIVLSLPDLTIAAERFEKLGFKVAPVARHDFGTENAMIYFANGSYIEPLAIGDPETVKEYQMKRYQFLTRDNAFRYRHGGEEFTGGFSMFVLSGDDVDEDRKLFKKAGLNTGKIAWVKRPGLAIRTIFAVDERIPDATCFICERTDGVPQFDSELVTHPNGAKRLARIILLEECPSDFADYIRIVSGQTEFVETEFGLDFELSNCRLSMMTSGGLKAEFGCELPALPLRIGPRLATYEIAVKNLDQTAMMLAEKGISMHQIGSRLVVANEPGQAVPLVFVEESDR